MNLDYLVTGFEVAFRWENLAYSLVGCFLGTLIGALPAIGPINGIGLLLPIAYALKIPPESTMIMLAAIYYGSEYGGRICSILLNVPGDASAAITAIDGYPLARQGRAAEALAISGLSSFVAAMLSVLALSLFAPVLGSLATGFGPAEMFVLMIFAFCTLTSLVGDDPVKTIVGCAIGLALTTVGLDPNSGAYRFTFDVPEMYDGIEFLIIIVGLFSVTEALALLEGQFLGNMKPIAVSNRYIPPWKDIKECINPTMRATWIGFIIGALPGAGATVASAVAYTTEKRISDTHGTFGKGDMRGLASPEAANNSAATGAFIPMLTLGVPGSATTAVMLGGLMLYNIQPGPQLFEEHPEIAGGLIASMYLGNIMLLILNLPLVKIFVRILTVPNYILVPGILVLSFLGVYATYSSVLSIYLMMAVGVGGYFLRKLGFDTTPIILGFVLGKVMETNLRSALAISGGDVGILFHSSISITMWVLALLILMLPLFASWRRRKAVPIPADQ